MRVRPVRILICLTLGVASSVGFAAWASTRARGHWDQRLERTDGDWWHGRLSSAGCDWYYSEFITGLVDNMGGTPRVPPIRRGEGTIDPTLNPAPYWRPPLRESVDYQTDVIKYSHIAAGWPLRCLAAGRDIRSSRWEKEAAWRGWELRFDVDDGFLSGHLIRGFKTRASLYMPTVPIPLGMAGNTAIYAIAWWLLLLAPDRIVNALRRRAGKCVKCKYDLTGIDADQPCPECGRVDEKRARHGSPAQEAPAPAA